MSEPDLPQDETSPVQLYCGNCGAPIPPRKHFCEECLAPASLAVPQPPAPLEADLAAEQPEPEPDVGEAVPPEPEAAAEGLIAEPEPTVVPLEPEPVSEVVPAAPPEPRPVPPVVPIVPSVAPGPAPVVPPTPSRPAPARWPWLVLLVGGAVLGLPLLFFGCIFLFLAAEATSDGSMTAEQFRLVSALCCVAPGVISTGLAILGGFQYFRRER